MKVQKKWLWLIWAGLFFFALGVIGYTWYLGSLGHWTKQNLSVVGFWLKYERALHLWGWFTGIYFVGYMIFLLWLSDYHGWLVWVFTIFAGILLVVGVYIPYLPEWSQFWSNVHIGLAFCSPVILLGAIVSFQLFLKKDRQFSMRLEMLLTVLFTLIAAALLIYYTIVTSVLEVYVVIVCVFLMNLLAIRLIHRQK